jgi:hypothetical protein
MIGSKSTRLSNGLYDGLFGVVDCETWQCRMFRNRQNLAQATIALANEGKLYFTFYHVFERDNMPNDDTIKERAKWLETQYPTEQQRYLWQAVKEQRDARIALERQVIGAIVARDELQKVTLKQRLEQVYNLDKRERYDND